MDEGQQYIELVDFNALMRSKQIQQPYEQGAPGEDFGYMTLSPKIVKFQSC